MDHNHVECLQSEAEHVTLSLIPASLEEKAPQQLQADKIMPSLIHSTNILLSTLFFAKFQEKKKNTKKLSQYSQMLQR